MTFSVSNFTAERRRWLSGALDKWAFAEVAAAILLFLINPFAGTWLGASGLMFAGLAGGVRISDRVLRSKAKTEKRVFRPRNTGLRIKVFRRVCVRSHVRAYRSAPRPSFACASGSDNSGGGGSESDPASEPPWPDFSFPAALFQNFVQKLNSFLFPWRSCDAPGCWGLPYRQPSAKGARS